jgi:hypothetical protein
LILWIWEGTGTSSTAEFPYFRVERFCGNTNPVAHRKSFSLIPQHHDAGDVAAHRDGDNANDPLIEFGKHLAGYPEHVVGGPENFMRRARRDDFSFNAMKHAACQPEYLPKIVAHQDREDRQVAVNAGKFLL